MKLNFRDLKQQRFALDFDPTDTIAQVKERLATEKGWEVAQQKLIHSGKILADANTVESYSFDDKSYIVCMVTKPKAPPAGSKSTAPAAPSTPSVSSTTPAPPAAPQQNTASTAPSNPPATPSPVGTGDANPAPAPAATPASTSTAPASFNDPSTLLVGEQGMEVVANMEAMGFERSEIDRAMRAAYFNPDRAVDYLLNGIPEGIQAEQRNAAAARNNPAGGAAAGIQAAGTTAQATGAATADEAATTAAADEAVNLFEQAAQAGGRGRGGAAQATGVGAGAGAGARAAAGAGGGLGDPASLDFLRNSPQFQQLRQLVQQQPAMLEPVLRQVAEGNPALANMIGQNQEQFLELLGEGGGGIEGIGGMGDTGMLPPGAHGIPIDEEDREAIERLCRLGFTRDQVVQAYFACEKNEELAANFLFDQPDDD